MKRKDERNTAESINSHLTTKQQEEGRKTAESLRPGRHKAATLTTQPTLRIGKGEKSKCAALPLIQELRMQQIFHCDLRDITQRLRKEKSTLKTAPQTQGQSLETPSAAPKGRPKTGSLSEEATSTNHPEN